MERFKDQSDLDAALVRLGQLDRRCVPFIELCQPIPLRQRPGGLGGLLRILLGQQVSVASANAIWQRFEAAYPGMEAKALAEASEEDLRACSLSRPKIKAVTRIAQAFADGFDPDGLLEQGLSVVRTELLALHGVGPWTADIYLLFCLGGRDVMPSGDLALQVAAAHLVGADERLSAKQLEELAASAWQPERSAAAHLLWAIYRDLKAGRDGVI
ncbi:MULTISPECIES: DNA-3-methyladenine glycosylase family protein [Cohaesibacter]|uniref:DNA-3-methyladenine glycosylase family protein n=1 Tax=Cohaesibacter TaxID=655352 RepID=UPI000DEBD80D|nr:MULTISPECIES: DNA-3-methyladenine glycosylase [Cohaesibacter]TLP46785.1 DNA-3-methyladenine glycosylase 2 family protein [Cohaesibacter sp. CAU 1516]